MLDEPTIPDPPPAVQGDGADAMRLIGYARLHPMECRTAAGTLLGPGPLRITRIAVYDAGLAGAYLFSCDDEWRIAFDLWTESVEEALAQARQAYPRSTGAWIEAR